ncbi:MAG: hypothetical protein QM778_27800 [Myxococcales bacterium]
MKVRDNLRLVARRLGPLLDQVVFVGGATVELLLTDRTAGGVRPTDDVDVIVRRTRLEYLRDLSTDLRRAGFKQDMSDDAPICRWIVDGVTVDIMPTSVDVLGFSNRWYDAAIATGEWHDLGEGVRVRVIAAPYFLATKMEAFKGRGRGDYLASADIEDVIAIMDGRPEVLTEVEACPVELRAYLAREFDQLLASDDFDDALEGFFRSEQVRKGAARGRCSALARADIDR